jgi:hypothetical protein
MAQSPGSSTADSAATGSVEPTLVALGLLLLVDFVLCAVMLATDKNLQTDFGGASAYYAHWYGVLAMGVVDLLAALVVFVLAVRPGPAGSPGFLRRNAGALGLLWSVVAIAAMVGIVTSWKQVGFASQSQFQTYLFGTSAYPGALSYIPWLYDALLAAYVVTAVVAIGALWRSRMSSRAGRPA